MFCINKRLIPVIFLFSPKKTAYRRLCPGLCGSHDFVRATGNSHLHHHTATPPMATPPHRKGLTGKLKSQNKATKHAEKALSWFIQLFRDRHSKLCQANFVCKISPYPSNLTCMFYLSQSCMKPEKMCTKIIHNNDNKIFTNLTTKTLPLSHSLTH